MQFLLVSMILALSSGALATTQKKANEYKSGDCSGAINFGHHSDVLGDVTMDDSSHSVYTNIGDAQSLSAYGGKTSNGGQCTGAYLGSFANGCHNLDHPAGLTPGRVECVRFELS